METRRGDDTALPPWPARREAPTSEPARHVHRQGGGHALAHDLHPGDDPAGEEEAPGRLPRGIFRTTGVSCTRPGVAQARVGNVTIGPSMCNLRDFFTFFFLSAAIASSRSSRFWPAVPQPSTCVWLAFVCRVQGDRAPPGPATAPVLLPPLTSESIASCHASLRGMLSRPGSQRRRMPSPFLAGAARRAPHTAVTTARRCLPSYPLFC